MKSSVIYVFSLAIGFALFSCKPVYKCGEKRPERFSAGNRLSDVVKERDGLCDQLKLHESENLRMTQRLEDLGKETTLLRSANSSLKGEVEGLQLENLRLKAEYQTMKDELIEIQSKFSRLYTDKGLDAQMFSDRIRLKEAELEEKERKINQNEALIRQREKEIQDREQAIQELQRRLDRQDSITRSINQALKNALVGFQSDEVSVETRDGKVYLSLSNKLLFKSGSVDIEAKGKDAIKILADVLKQNGDIDVMVEGHTDNVPIKTARFADNWDLSVARATTIVRMLTTTYSVAPTRLTAAGRGEFMPKASNETAEGKALNRRTEIILTPNLEKILKLIQD
jgi:chemotaxis protein MotB